jgi:hypothetical protein
MRALVCQVLDRAACPPLGETLHDMTLKNTRVFMLIAPTDETVAWLSDGGADDADVTSRWTKSLITWRLLPLRPSDEADWLREPVTCLEATWLWPGGGWFALRRREAYVYDVYGPALVMVDVTRLVDQLAVLLGASSRVRPVRPSSFDAFDAYAVPSTLARWRVASALLLSATDGQLQTHWTMLRMLLDYMTEVRQLDAGAFPVMGRDNLSTDMVMGELVRQLLWRLPLVGPTEQATALRIQVVHPDVVYRASEAELTQLADSFRHGASTVMPNRVLIPIATAGHWSLLVGYYHGEHYAGRYEHFGSFQFGTNHHRFALQAVAALEDTTTLLVTREQLVTQCYPPTDEDQVALECGAYVLAAGHGLVEAWLAGNAGPRHVTRKMVSAYFERELQPFWARVADPANTIDAIDYYMPLVASKILTWPGL